MFNLNDFDEEIKPHVKDLIEMFGLNEEQLQDLLCVVNDGLDEIEASEKGEFFSYVNDENLASLRSETTIDIYSNKNEDFYLYIEVQHSQCWGSKISDVSIAECREFNPQKFNGQRKDWVLKRLSKKELEARYGSRGEKFINAAINAQNVNAEYVEKTFSEAKYDAFVTGQPISNEAKNIIKRFGFKIEKESII